MTAFWTPDSQALSPYRSAQALADKCLQIIAASLPIGMTEQDCELLMRDWLRAHQVYDPARPPRARFYGQRQRRRFGLNRPGKRRYKPGMSYILRCDAVQNGYAAKACLNGPDSHAGVTALAAELDAFKAALPDALADGQSPQQLAESLPGLRQHYRLAPITGTLPEGNRIAEGPLIPGLWQWQLTLSRGDTSVASSDFLVVDDQGARWLSPRHGKHDNKNHEEAA
ncbi:MAG: hypothetical protein MI745_16930 [Pseudomonadales bacterium]|nr:hypothetical protein [Pseudomonadales bacterium]